MNQPPTIEALRHSYDAVPYKSFVDPKTHIDTLAMAAVVAGLSPVPIARCRVLEIGCASGANLLPMAQSMPDSTFVGIDLSAKQIIAANHTAAAAGLKNIRFEAANLLDLKSEIGHFDYIIAHGVYSWVPAEVQEGLLKAIQQHLQVGGVACVSFTTYPGMHMLMMAREMMQYHTRNLTDPMARAARARQLIETLYTTVPFPPPEGQATLGHSYGSYIRAEAEIIQRCPDSFIAHDHLETFNTPVYFHQFAAQLASHGLRYLGEARPHASRSAVENVIRARFPEVADDPLAIEQYFDFATGSRFRMSLIVHASNVIGKVTDPAAIEGLFIKATLFPAMNALEVYSVSPMMFQAENGTQISVKDPVAKGLLAALARDWPGVVSVEALLDRLRKELQYDAFYATPGTAERAIVARMILSCAAKGFLELFSYAPKFVRQLSDMPKAALLSRIQARDREIVINALHRAVLDLTQLDRVVLAHLSGARDRGALVEGIRAAIAKGILPPAAKDSPAALEVGFVQPVDQTLETSLEQSLSRLADRFLLIS